MRVRVRRRRLRLSPRGGGASARRYHERLRVVAFVRLAPVEAQVLEVPVLLFVLGRGRTLERVPGLVAGVVGVRGVAEPDLRARMDVKLFVDAAPDVRLMRRMERDLHERGRDIESILQQYQHTVRPMHLEFVEPSKRRADVIIPHGGHNRVALDMVLAHVDSLLETGKG